VTTSGNTPRVYLLRPIKVPGQSRSPLRSDFAHLSRSFLQAIHAWYPALHWPTFQHEVDEIYASRSFEGCSRGWIGLFFAVLACGTLQPATDHKSRGQAFFEIATSYLQPWPQDLSVTHAQVALLLSIFAQELQICPEVDCWAPVESEVRRRIWWSLYVRDR
jgi:hypothetical protein